jgi:hypothetical protein
MQSYHETDPAVNVNCALDPILTTEKPCSRCGCIDVPHVEHGPFGPHAAKTVCKHCGTWLQWLSERSPEERQARAEHFRREAIARKPVTERQLATLRAMGYIGPLPSNRQAAIDLIDALSKQAEVAQ